MLLGDFVKAKMGWQLYAGEPAMSVVMVLTAKALALQTEEQKRAHKTRSRALGVMGPPGQTAWFGLCHKRLGNAKPGMLIFVSDSSSVSSCDSTRSSDPATA